MVVEAVRSGTVVVTGPHTGNFDDAYTTLRKARAAVLVPDSGDLATAVAALLGPEGDLAERRSAGERALAELAGACDRTVDALLALLEEKATARRAG
jgi:3-deoxy-D-manno-octulosonic-acid transferase